MIAPGDATSHAVRMARGGPRLGSVLKGLGGAPVYSVRWTLLTFSLISVGLGVWGAATGREGVAFGGSR